MLREEIIRRHFNRDMRLIEIGPSYNPIIPRADGWQTTIVDHATQEELVEKYGALGVATVDRVEPVDHVWQGGSLAALVPADQHGTFDGLVASHVCEHLPDLIGFLESTSAIIKPGGLLALALPDKRVCFDFFQPITMTSDLIAAHRDGRSRHRREAFFNQAAYTVHRGSQIGWAHAERSAGFALVNPLSDAQSWFDKANQSEDSDYQDTHAWTFTPKSFELLMLELNLLGHTDWAVRAIEPAGGVEFYAWLERKTLSMPDSMVNPLRLSLLADMAKESGDAIAQLGGQAPAEPPPPLPAPAQSVARPASPRPAPSIVAIIPLYNGSRTIEHTLLSVFRQTLPATEIIVVDDGSTDGGAGAAIVERLAQTHPVTLLRKPNSGQSASRNFAVHHSTSELIAFLDHDDIWYSDHLEQLVKPFTRKRSQLPLGWVYSNLDEIDEGGQIISRDYLSTIGTAHPKRHIFDCIRQDMFILPSATLISRAAFEAVGGFDERLCGYEDDDLFMRLFRAGYDNVYVNKSLSQWRIFPGSASYSYRMAVSRSIYARKLLDFFPDDAKRARYYTRDLVIPRFIHPALGEYEAALKKGDPRAVASAWDEVIFLLRQDDSVAPRIVDHVLKRYKSALSTGDRELIAERWAEVSDVLSRIPNVRRRLLTTLSLLRNPVLSRSAFALRRLARPVMLWAFCAGAPPRRHA